MKKILIIIGLAVVGAVGIIFFNFNDNSRIPKDGIYFIKQNSSYAYSEDEDKIIYLDFYRTSNKKDESATRFSDVFSNITLASGEGNANILRIDDELTLDDSFSYKGKYINRYSFGVKIAEKDIVITSVSFEDAEGKTCEQNLNSIEVRSLESKKESIYCYSDKLVWESYVHPVISHEEVIIENNSGEDALLCGLDYGNIGIVFSDAAETKIGGEDETVIDWNVSQSADEEENEPIIYYSKPVADILTGDEHINIPFENVSKEAYYGENESVGEYLFSYENN